MNKLLDIAIKASVAAGAAIMEVYSGDFDVELKSDYSPLTIADEKANMIINTILEPTLIPIISEENIQLEYENRKNWKKCWMVDPLDGTKEFVKRNGEFTVNIALINEGKPVLGVIYIPVSKTLYYTIVEENKAYKITLQNHSFSKEHKVESQIIYPQIFDENEIRVIASRSHLNEETQIFISDLEQKEKKVFFVTAGSSLKFCLMAEGKANIYPRFAPTMEWDTAAGHAICKAVGLKILEVNSEKELQYNKQNLLNPYFVVKK